LIRFQADADLNHAIVVGVRKREPAIDFASALDSNLDGVQDAEVLVRAAKAGRILVSHDRKTMIGEFRRHIATGPSPGLLIVSQLTPVGQVVEALVTLWSVSDESEWVDQIVHLPSLKRHVMK
jgi:hypothetical protein